MIGRLLSNKPYIHARRKIRSGQKLRSYAITKKKAIIGPLFSINKRSYYISAPLFEKAETSNQFNVLNYLETNPEKGNNNLSDFVGYTNIIIRPSKTVCYLLCNRIRYLFCYAR